MRRVERDAHEGERVGRAQGGFLLLLYTAAIRGASGAHVPVYVGVSVCM